MMKDERSEYVLIEYGIVTPIRILGSATKLLPALGVPVVFLIDETHTQACIAQNIDNAKELVQRCNVSLVGVESHLGGFEWDDCSHRYSSNFNNGENTTPFNTCPQFAEGMRKSGAKVLGVECRGLSNELECDFMNNPPPPPISDRQFNVDRSKHFIITLFQLRSKHGLDGNLILNAGGNHNSHIARWIQAGIIESITGVKSAYIRLRAPAYQR
jgi:hypothetical protein